MGARRGSVGADNIAIITAIKEYCFFPVTDSQITIEVKDRDGVVLEDPEDRTPDNTIHVIIDILDIEMITHSMGFLDTVNLHSESEFLIE